MFAKSYLTNRRKKKRERENYGERGIISLHVSKKVWFVIVVLRWQSKSLKKHNDAANAGK